MKSKHSPFSIETHKIMIRYLTFKIVLHNRHKNFCVLVTLSESDRDKENKNKTKKQTLQPSYSYQLNIGTENMREQYTIAQKSKNF